MKKRKQTKIELKKIQVARLDRRAGASIKGGTLLSFILCDERNTGSLKTKVGIAGDALCERTFGCPSAGNQLCRESEVGNKC
ncbi:hypothetical protein [Aquimarina spongiae]|uniref:Uncharacterized protein n=1 Tax=Aquimarina spongiae TaxID=570521 RepID=A0A1M6LII2_9FLAO|nr:hypothetical protein [Aquimarina spongiae]SHJ70982.1 hypothetical protein SAMN04488508_11716 [Aquimarina spongiae]